MIVNIISVFDTDEMAKDADDGESYGLPDVHQIAEETNMEWAANYYGYQGYRVEVAQWKETIGT